MSERVVMSIDQGTTGSRVSLYKHDGTPYPNGWCYVEHSQSYPKPGWVEHDPVEIWLNVKHCIRNVLDMTGVKPGEIVAIGVTNQRETVVAWNPKTGRPVSNAIVWQDRRTAKLVDYLRENFLKDIVEKTGLIPDSYFSSTKIWWMLENIKGLREKALKGEVVFGTVDTWIIWNLTNGSRDIQTPEYKGAFVTDYSNASRTMLFNIHGLMWDEGLAEIQGKIPVEALAIPRPSSDKEVYGWTGPEVSSLFEGLSKPVAGDAGDQQAALLGQAGFEPYDVKCTYGTGNFILMNTGGNKVCSKSGLLTTILYSVEPGKAVYALEGSVFITGAAIQWLRDGLKIIEVSGEVNPLAEAAEDTGGTYFVPAFTGLGAPYWDPYARGMIIGLTRGTGRRHIARAVLESIAYLTRDVVEAMSNDTGRRVEKLKADGGASRSDFLLQFQSDILNATVVRPFVQETTSLGVAYLAGLAVGFWRSISEARKNWRMEKEFSPRMSREVRERLYGGWKAAVKRSLGWAMEVPWAYGYE